LDEGQEYCKDCGQRAGTVEKKPPYAVQTREKSEGITVLFSLLWAGAGHVYVGKISKGFAIILVYFMLFAIIGYLLTIGSWEYSHSDWFYDYYYFKFTYLREALLLTIPLFILWLWNIFDAYKSAKEYNSSIKTTGNPPW